MLRSICHYFHAVLFSKKKKEKEGSQPFVEPALKQMLANYLPSGKGEKKKKKRREERGELRGHPKTAILRVSTGLRFLT